MIKTALLIFLTLFFTMSGINHFFNPHVLHEYMERRKYKHVKILVFLSGLLLIVGGVLLQVPYVRMYASFALAGFVLIAAFMIHSFWRVSDKHERMLEMQNFIKNFVIFFEMIYIGLSFQ